MIDSKDLYIKRVKLNLKKVDITGLVASSLVKRKISPNTKYSSDHILLGRDITVNKIQRGDSLEVGIVLDDDLTKLGLIDYEWKEPEEDNSLQSSQEARENFFGSKKYNPTDSKSGCVMSSKLSAIFERNKQNKNRFFVYSQFAGTNTRDRRAVQKINIYFDKSLGVDDLVKISTSVLMTASVKEVIGYFLYIFEEDHLLKLKDTRLEMYQLKVADEDGIEDECLPAIEFNKNFKDYIYDDLLLVYLQPETESELKEEAENNRFSAFETFDNVTSREKCVSVNSSFGFSAFNVSHQYVTIHEIVRIYLKKRCKESILTNSFYVEHVKNIGVPLNLESTISEYEPLQFTVTFHDGSLTESPMESLTGSANMTNNNKNSFTVKLVKSYAGNVEAKLFLQSDMIVIVPKLVHSKSVSLGKLPKNTLIYMKDISSYECQPMKNKNDPVTIALKHLSEYRIRKLCIQMNVNEAGIFISHLRTFFARK